MTKPEIYLAQIEELNGEQEYLQEIYIVANSEKQANKFAEKLAKGWYDDSQPKKDENGYWYNWDGIAWKLRNVSKAEYLYPNVYDIKSGWYSDKYKVKLVLEEIKGE